jgi:hypothetical protein
MPRSNTYAVFGSDMLLPVERVLKFYRGPYSHGAREKSASSPLGGDD